MNAIETQSLTRTFKGGIEAVRGIDLAIQRGEVFGFLGPNGAGKTTTVRMLCTLLPPTSGEAHVAGLDVVREAAAVRRRIGVALQEIGLDPAQTGRELLELQCGLYGITGQSARERANELLELVGLVDAADRRTKTYSGGMKRRLDLASALVHSHGLRSLVIDGWNAGRIGACIAVIAGLGAVLTVLSLRAIATYDR